MAFQTINNRDGINMHPLKIEIRISDFQSAYRDDRLAASEGRAETGRDSRRDLSYKREFADRK